MNQIVQAWNRCSNRKKHEGPDSLTVEDITVQFDKDSDMKTEALTSEQFDTIIRLVKEAELGRVNGIRGLTFSAMKRLQVKRDKMKAVKGIPKASCQVNLGSFTTWLSSVCKDNKKAMEQIIAIDATAVKRSE